MAEVRYIARVNTVASKKRRLREEINRTEKRYEVTHKVYNIQGMNHNDVLNSPIKIDGVNCRLSEISCIDCNLLYVRPKRGLSTLGNNVLTKNPWIALVIRDVISNKTETLYREQVLKSGILNYAYNASYTNNGTSVRINEITDKDIEEIDNKIKLNIAKYNEEKQKAAERFKKITEENLKKKQTEDKHIETGKKIYELMLELENIHAKLRDAIRINGTTYLRYENYLERHHEKGYMRFSEGNNELYITGFFLDEEYSTEYQRYATEQFDSNIINDLKDLSTVTKASSCDDAGYLNKYTVETNTHAYEIVMYLHEYDGEFCIKATNPSVETYNIQVMDKPLFAQSQLNQLIKIHKALEKYNTVKNQLRISIIPNIPIIKELITFGLHADDDCKHKIMNMINSEEFRDSIYYLILVNKLCART